MFVLAHEYSSNNRVFNSAAIYPFGSYIESTRRHQLN